MKLSNNMKQKIEKAAERYGKREARKITYCPKNVMDRFALESAFLDGIEWYQKNCDKLAQEEALDKWLKICKE